jgi:hypothetical protein
MLLFCATSVILQMGQIATTQMIWVMVAEGKADPRYVPPFSPGFFARGQLSPLRNILAA